MSPFKLNSIMLVITSSFTMNTLAEEVASAPEEREIERLIIKGTKQELTLQEIDASVELFSEERLNAERIVDVNDALLRIPNVVNSGASNDISIRGIGRSGASDVGQGVTSNVYVDGSPLSGIALNRSFTSVWDVQQVEVLRGSQSSIQGRNALAGAIVITTADPTYSPEGKFRLTYAEDNTYQIAGAYSNTIVDNQLAFRLSADIQKSDGFIEHTLVDGKNSDFEDRLLLRGKLLFEPEAIDNLTMKLIVDHNDNDIGEARPRVNTSFDITEEAFETYDVFDFVASGDFIQNDVKSTRVILDTHYALSNNWSVKSILTHESTKVDRQFNFEDRVDEFEIYAFNQFDEEVNSLELRFTFDYDNISGVLGGYYFENKTDQQILNQVLLAPAVSDATFGFGSITTEDALLGITNQTITETENLAFFAQVRVDLTKALTLDLGIRYDNEEFDNSGPLDSITAVDNDACEANVPGALIGAPGFISLSCSTLIAAFFPEAEEAPQSASYNAWLPKATLTYQLNDENSIFASAQRGYRAGGSYLTKIINENTPTGTEQIVDTYTPEYLNTLEIGSRSVFSDGDMILNTNIFYSEYKDQQVGLTGISLSDVEDDLIVNAAESTISGIEILYQYYVTQAFDIYASLGFLSAEFDDFPFAETGEFSNLAGNKQPDSPEFSASIGANWRSDNGLFANISAFYLGSKYSGVENLDNSNLYQSAIDTGVSASVASTLTEEIDSYVNVNLRVGYDLDNFTVYAFGTNILDEEVITNSFVAGINQVSGDVSFSTGGTTTNILPPRSFGVGIDYAF